jgi:hypothetical protein
MVDLASLEQARRWRLKAEECRTVADQMMNPMAQASLRRIAETYDTLASRIEERLARVAAAKQRAR